MISRSTKMQFTIYSFSYCRRRSNEALDKWIATRKNGRQTINFVQVKVVDISKQLKYIVIKPKNYDITFY